jgi:hypothetical protein
MGSARSDVRQDRRGILRAELLRHLYPDVCLVSEIPLLSLMLAQLSTLIVRRWHSESRWNDKRPVPQTLVRLNEGST